MKIETLDQLKESIEKNTQYTAIVIIDSTPNENYNIKINNSDLYVADIIIINSNSNFRSGECYEFKPYNYSNLLIDVAETRLTKKRNLYTAYDCIFENELYHVKTKLDIYAFNQPIIANNINYFKINREPKKFVYDYIDVKTHDEQQLCCITKSGWHNIINRHLLRPFIYEKNYVIKNLDAGCMGYDTSYNCRITRDSENKDSNQNYSMIEIDYKRLLYDNIFYKKSFITNKGGCIFVKDSLSDYKCLNITKIYRGTAEPYKNGMINQYIHTSIRKSAAINFCNRRDIDDKITNPNGIHGYVYEFTIDSGIPYIPFDSTHFRSHFAFEEEILLMRGCHIKITSQGEIIDENALKLDKKVKKKYMYFKAEISFPNIDVLQKSHAELITERYELEVLEISDTLPRLPVYIPSNQPEEKEHTNDNKINIEVFNNKFREISEYDNILTIKQLKQIYKDKFNVDLLDYELYEMYNECKCTQDINTNMILHHEQYNNIDQMIKGFVISKEDLYKFINNNDSKSKVWKPLIHFFKKTGKSVLPINNNEHNENVLSVFTQPNNVSVNNEMSSVKPDIVFNINKFNKYFDEVSENTGFITRDQFSYFYINYYAAFITINEVKSFFKIINIDNKDKDDPTISSNEILKFIETNKVYKLSLSDFVEKFPEYEFAYLFLMLLINGPVFLNSDVFIKNKNYLIKKYYIGKKFKSEDNQALAGNSSQNFDNLKPLVANNLQPKLDNNLGKFRGPTTIFGGRKTTKRRKIINRRRMTKCRKSTK